VSLLQMPRAHVETGRAAERPRGEPPAVAVKVAFTLCQPGGQGKRPFGAARRAGSIELSGGKWFADVGCAGRF